jgi:hypothetical protein
MARPLSFSGQRYASGAGVAPAGNFLKSIGARLLEKSDEMPGVLEFVDVRPHLSLPAIVMDGGGTAGSTPGMQLFGEAAWLGGLRL